MDALGNALDSLQAGVQDQHRKLDKAVKDQEQFYLFLNEVEGKLDQLEMEISALSEPEKAPNNLLDLEEILHILRTVEERKDDLKSRLNETVELVHPACVYLDEEGKQSVENGAHILENRWSRFLSIISSAKTYWHDLYFVCREFDNARLDCVAKINDCKRYVNENFSLIDLDVEKKKEKLTALKAVEDQASALQVENVSHLRQMADNAIEKVNLPFISLQYNETVQSYQQLLTLIQVS